MVTRGSFSNEQEFSIALSREHHQLNGIICNDNFPKRASDIFGCSKVVQYEP
jgi:hypothetical protein